MTTNPQATTLDFGAVLIEDLEQALATTINTAVPVLTQDGMVLLLGAINNLINHHANQTAAVRMARGIRGPNPAPIVPPPPVVPVS